MKMIVEYLEYMYIRKQMTLDRIQIKIKFYINCFLKHQLRLYLLLYNVDSLRKRDLNISMLERYFDVKSVK